MILPRCSARLQECPAVEGHTKAGIVVRLSAGFTETRFGLGLSLRVTRVPIPAAIAPTTSTRSRALLSIFLINESVSQRKANQFTGAVQVQFFHDPAAVSFYRVHTQIESGRDLLVSSSLRDVLQNLSFAAGQQIDRVGYVLPVISQDAVGDGWAKIPFTARHSAHSHQQVVVSCVLEEIAFGTRPEDLPDVHRVF